MRVLPLFLLLAVLPVPVGASDRAPDDATIWNFQWENDIFTGLGTDKHYTNGMRFSFLRPDDAVPGMWWDTGRPMNRPLDWGAVREMHENGVDIGAHTRHHARLSDLSLEPEKLRDELDGARQDLESKLGSPCRYMSWPFG